MMTMLRRAVPVLALTALLVAACGGPADSVGQAVRARPASLLAGGPERAAKVPVGFQPASVSLISPAFQPASASFISPTTGYVLGGVGCQTQQACKARLMATADSGAHWHFAGAPAVRFFNGGYALRGQRSRVSSVVFASRADGWLYGPGLWATHDGGAHWRKLSLGGGIDTMAVGARTVYAVVSPRGGGQEELYASPAGEDAWARVGTMTGDPGAVLAVSGKAAWFGTSVAGTRGGVVWATADGVHWHQHPFRCPGAAYYGLSGIAAASPSHVVFLCTGNGAMGSLSKEVLTSADGGQRLQLAGLAPLGGGTDGIAVPPHDAKVITLAAVSGANFLDRSADGGKTWTQVTYPLHGVWSSLSYLSRTVGWVVLGQPGLGSGNQLWRTSDAGLTWHPVSF
jgi:hypothetical protein